MDRKEITRDLRQHFGSGFISFRQAHEYIGRKCVQTTRAMLKGVDCVRHGNRKLYHIKDIAELLASKRAVS